MVAVRAGRRYQAVRPRRPQTAGGAGHRMRGRLRPVPAPLQPRPQSHRAGVCETESAHPRGAATHLRSRRGVGGGRNRPLHPARMRRLRAPHGYRPSRRCEKRTGHRRGGSSSVFFSLSFCLGCSGFFGLSSTVNARQPHWPCWHCVGPFASCQIHEWPQVHLALSMLVS